MCILYSGRVHGRVKEGAGKSKKKKNVTPQSEPGARDDESDGILLYIRRYLVPATPTSQPTCCLLCLLAFPPRSEVEVTEEGRKRGRKGGKGSLELVQGARKMLTARRGLLCLAGAVGAKVREMIRKRGQLDRGQWTGTVDRDKWTGLKRSEKLK